MKRTLSLILTLVMIIGIFTSVPVTVSASSESNLIFELNSDGLSYSVTDCDENVNGDISIPDTYNSLPVTGVGASAFKGCKGLVSVTIPDSVTSIGASAFQNCESLTSITIPCGVTNIGRCTFMGTDLVSVTIPDGVTSIGAYAFSECLSLSSIIIPDSVESIGEDAFSCCESLVSIAIPDSVTSIGRRAFMGSALRSITIPGSVRSIGSYAFGECLKLKAVTISDGLESIGEGAFSYCEKLTSITIGNGVNDIGNYAFSGCGSLTTITLPHSVTTIGKEAFGGCDSLAAINVDKNNQSFSASGGVLFDKGKTRLIQYPLGKAGSDYVIPDGVKSIGEAAFKYCTTIASVTIPDSVKSIGAFAFAACTSLTDVTIGKGVTSIGNDAFYGCGELESVFYTGTKESWKKVKKEWDYFPAIHYGTTEHTSSGWIIDKKATVNSAGKKVKKCTVCGKVLKTAKIDQLKCSKPSITKIANKDYGVKIVWDDVKGADSYKVYRKVSDGKYAYLDKTTKTAFADKTAKSGKKYYYVVKAVNEAGSSEKSASKSITFVDAPTIKTPTTAKSGITVKWSKVTGAEGYIVYRKTGSGSYERLAKIKGGTKVSYLDKSAKKGKTYSYKVLAYNGSTKSAGSEVKTIKDKY